MKIEILRLFKSYLGENVNDINKDALKYGLIIPTSADKEVVEAAIELYGKDGQKWNETFHKDFEIVKNAPILDLVSQQILHYLTTYGFEELGIFCKDTVYIPKEEISIPDLDIEDIEMIVIKPITEDELSNKIEILVNSGIALSKQSVEDILVLSDYINSDNYDNIKNREVKVRLYDKYQVTPKNPEEFLRFLIFKLTDSTLKIQNSEMIYRLKNSDKQKTLNLLDNYIKNNGYEKLSSIFLRNKKLFLSLKTKDKRYIRINTIINKLRKLANKYHKPLKKNVLDCLTDRNVNVDFSELAKALENITIFREIRILNGILYRLSNNENIVYRIRNGKSFVSKVEDNDENYTNRLNQLADYIKRHLLYRLSQKVSGKVIYIPNNITYAAPTSEKQFSGNIPQGSYISVPRNSNFVYGVHWNNLSGEPKKGYYGEIDGIYEERVDLDLKQMNKNEVFGWDASYRDDNRNILFSGDMTDAPLPNGATELFYVNQNYGCGAFLITLNMFTNNSTEVPFEFVIAKEEKSSNIRRGYVLNPNNIIEKIDMVIKNTERQKNVGLIVISDEIRFYLNDFSIGSSCRTSSRTPITMGAFDYMQTYIKTQLKLNDLLIDAGALVIDTPTINIEQDFIDEEGNTKKELKEIKADIDLSIQNIDKSTIIDLLS